MPLAILSRHLLSPRMVRWFGLLICSLGIGLLLFIVLREWNFATEYRWQRIGFVAITQVDFPSVQLVVVGVFLCLHPHPPSRKNRAASGRGQWRLTSGPHQPKHRPATTLAHHLGPNNLCWLVLTFSS